MEPGRTGTGAVPLLSMLHKPLVALLLPYLSISEAGRLSFLCHSLHACPPMSSLIEARGVPLSAMRGLSPQMAPGLQLLQVKGMTGNAPPQCLSKCLSGEWPSLQHLDLSGLDCYHDWLAQERLRFFTMPLIKAAKASVLDALHTLLFPSTPVKMMLGAGPEPEDDETNPKPTTSPRHFFGYADNDDTEPLMSFIHRASFRNLRSLSLACWSCTAEDLYSILQHMGGRLEEMGLPSVRDRFEEGTRGRRGRCSAEALLRLHTDMAVLLPQVRRLEGEDAIWLCPPPLLAAAKPPCRLPAPLTDLSLYVSSRVGGPIFQSLHHNDTLPRLSRLDFCTTLFDGHDDDSDSEDEQLPGHGGPFFAPPIPIVHPPPPVQPVEPQGPTSFETAFRHALLDDSLSRLTELNLQLLGRGPEATRVLQAMAAHFPSTLRVWRLRMCDPEGDGLTFDEPLEQGPLMPSDLPNLETLVLHRVGVLSQWPSALSAPRLTTLDLRDCFSDSSALQTVLATLPRTLRQLTLRAAHHFGAEMASQLGQRLEEKALPELRSLDLSLCALGPEGSVAIIQALGGSGAEAGCPHLHTLGLKMVMGGEAMVEALIGVAEGGGMGKVRELGLSGNEAWRVDVMTRLEEMLTRRLDQEGLEGHAPVKSLPFLQRLLLVEKYGGSAEEWDERRRVREAVLSVRPGLEMRVEPIKAPVAHQAM